MFDQWKMKPKVTVAEGAIKDDNKQSPDGDTTKGAVFDFEALSAVQKAREEDRTTMANAMGPVAQAKRGGFDHRALYGGTVPVGVKADRRAKGKLAKASRRRNRVKK